VIDSVLTTKPGKNKKVNYWVVSHWCKGEQRTISFSKGPRGIEQQSAACLHCGEIFLVEVKKLR
jgi:hypothetical protein